MKSKALLAVALIFLLGITMTAYGITMGQARTDCPGKITCPLTGEEVCKDKCPLRDASRSDCPGKIECPITGELVCRDECPLGSEADQKSEVPACCRNRK